MNRLLFLAATLFLAAPLWGQEIVVFKDYRSLVVQSHRAQGDWTYLNINNGELAVQSSLILEIRKEGTDIRTPSLPAPQPQTQPTPEPAKPPRPADMRTLRSGAGAPVRPARLLPPPQPPPTDEDDADDEGSGDEDDDDEGGSAQPVKPPTSNPARPTIPETSKPDGGAVPRALGRE